MKTLVKTAILSFLLTLSCQEETKKPKVSYKQETKKEAKNEASKLVQISDLPIQFQGSNVLIFSIGKINLVEYSRSGFDSSGGTVDQNYRVINSIDDEITGFMTNIKFQSVGQDSLKTLSTNNIGVERVTFLKSKKKLVYIVYDQDTNQDDTIDTDDIKTLYISNDNGEDFVKISSNQHEVIDWKFIESTQSIYFRSIEDTNKNGKFDQTDALHFYEYNVDTKTTKEIKL